jgi:hypothetical protein
MRLARRGAEEEEVSFPFSVVTSDNETDGVLVDDDVVVSSSSAQRSRKNTVRNSAPTETRPPTASGSGGRCLLRARLWDARAP